MLWLLSSPPQLSRNSHYPDLWMRQKGLERLILSPQGSPVKSTVHSASLWLMRGAGRCGRQKDRILRTHSRKEGAVPKTTCSSRRKDKWQYIAMTKEQIDSGPRIRRNISPDLFSTWKKQRQRRNEKGLGTYTLVLSYIEMSSGKHPDWKW